MKKDNYPLYVETIDQLLKNIYNMDKQIKVLEKALELACNKLYAEMENPLSELYYYMADEMPDYFKTKAKEMMKSE